MKAKVDRRRNDLGSDVQRARVMLAAIDHPPNESDESVARLIDEGWTFAQGDVMIRVNPFPDRKHVEIAWWLPLSQWLTPDGLGVLVEVCEAVIAKYGEEANDWTIGGQFDAPGGSPEEIHERSTKAAEINKRWLPDVEIGPDPNSNYARADSTVGKVIAMAKAFLDAA